MLEGLRSATPDSGWVGMTYRLCQRRCGADRTIRLFSGVGGRSREIDANRLDRHGRTRATCRRGPSFRQLLLCECHYDENAVALPLADEPRRAATALRFREAAGRRRGARAIAPQIVLPAACNTRRFCVPNGVERCATDFLP
ncbi:hypothetical protein [Burkholderia ubonensis]|uniref:hypothetical protein n=1 Tax=Burkholderia ubonensis TaxID=101571 RepID=UPI0012F9246E|nr:hypothetical protein [Burkholderia ubonensis]